MSAEKTASGIEAIEVEAERILKEARNRASEILLKANEEANRISSSGLALAEARAECEKIVVKARQEADQKVEEARIKASELRAEVGRKMGGIVARLIKDITGV